MRKLQKAAVAAAMMGTFSCIATGTATAQSAPVMYGGGGCKSHDLNVGLLGQVGLLNGLLGNAINGEGNAGGQHQHVGSSCGHGH
ncbi:hypothetical protein QQY66_17985 [Streptomyces sp. DG2A-72]|uniref:hypothetical protein n=1 Tax=Streptomyces sp. DG2A-72 TaxID=3051386 RepID=UPI00265BDC8D|nr:hypothetical protein [Streptomyces sp. DG2A-72]MDO0933484.1 hypothetical protein [Streptomyces sp. DG2A-72]